ncbi:MAG: hypothetical protein ACRDDM_11820, partial [Paraclostridium sp.]
DKDYNGASSKFLEKVDYYTKADSAPTSYFSRVNSRVTSLSTYILSLIISIVVTLIVTQKSKGKVTANNGTYEAGGSFNLTNNKDILVNENTTRTKIVKTSNETNSSNTSTTHESSSGSTHGGGGGSF